MKAQSAILNPSKRWKDFAMKQELGVSNVVVEDFEVKFSPNVVCLEVSSIFTVVGFRWSNFELDHGAGITKSGFY